MGPLPFDRFVELALYDPDSGFYTTGGSAGRAGRGDFLTSPEIGALFGAVVARALDRWWEELGAPDPYVVVEAAAGAGTLARAVLDASPACLPALRYLMVERSAALRERQAQVVPVEPAALVLGPMGPADEEDEEGLRALPGRGPRVASLAELPSGSLTGIVLANELLDNLPFGLLERRNGAWWEVRVGEGEVVGELAEVLVPAPPAVAADADRLAPAARDGARVPIQREAAAWLRGALRLLERGRVVVVDYAATTAELAARPWTEWVRTYRGGGRGGPPLERPGSQDITVEVCLDQLETAARPAEDRPQAAFLRAHGIADLTAEAAAAWQAAAARPDVGALRARSRMLEAEALTDEAGLGAFRVLEWEAPRRRP